MTVRTPIVAGQFYPSSESAARGDAKQCLNININISDLPEDIVAGVVPHAGWVCSGAVAARTFLAIQARHANVGTFVIFGADHRRGIKAGAMFAKGQWETPLGPARIDEDLAGHILAATKTILDDESAHGMEHSIEVQVPFIQDLFPEAKILPIMVPPTGESVSIGRAVGEVIRDCDIDAVCVGSSDLTHYGPNYAFTPKGVGEEGIRWSKDVNDRELLDRMVALDAEGVVRTAATSRSACGAGAIAAAIAAGCALGADRAVVLEHTNSAEVLAGQSGDDMKDAVGYASVVFGK